MVFDLLTQMYTQCMYHPVQVYKYTGLCESDWSLCPLHVLSDGQESADIGWCILQGINTTARVVIFSSKHVNL